MLLLTFNVGTECAVSSRVIMPEKTDGGVGKTPERLRRRHLKVTSVRWSFKVCSPRSSWFGGGGAVVGALIGVKSDKGH